MCINIVSVTRHIAKKYLYKNYENDLSGIQDKFDSKCMYDSTRLYPLCISCLSLVLVGR